LCRQGVKSGAGRGLEKEKVDAKHRINLEDTALFCEFVVTNMKIRKELMLGESVQKHQRVKDSQTTSLPDHKLTNK
jgi:hypothetical protein